ncbi:hypothetical protein Sgleb_73230 [Streptomyces glebosus]|uniref:Uncharacterized protein n=1 Tax=Streptomyces glebosus TaxID=249580 RepID=A0A640TAG3_9ACTN|nr:hypothetical protein Sgleb_73230 [Streptomyces glebosus]GHG79079.1 hypothetical protein GCM10010513_56120 [Streptomyces glebosus]
MPRRPGDHVASLCDWLVPHAEAEARYRDDATATAIVTDHPYRRLTGRRAPHSQGWVRKTRKPLRALSKKAVTGHPLSGVRCASRVSSPAQATTEEA